MTKFIISNTSGTVNVHLTTDKILAAQNEFTIMKISGVSPLDITNNHGEKLIVAAFPRGLKTQIDTLVTFATTNGFNLTQIDGNNSSAVQLVVLGSQS